MRNAATPYSPADEAREDYETAMAVHDAEVAARALREAAQAMGPEAYLRPASWLAERADQVERGEVG